MKLFIILYTSKERITLLISSTPLRRKNFISFPNTLIAKDIYRRNKKNPHRLIAFKYLFRKSLILISLKIDVVLYSIFQIKLSLTFGGGTLSITTFGNSLILPLRVSGIKLRTKRKTSNPFFTRSELNTPPGLNNASM